MSKLSQFLLRPAQMVRPLTSAAAVASACTALLALSSLAMPVWAAPLNGSGDLVTGGESTARENSTQAAKLETMEERTADGKPYQITTAEINAPPEEVFDIIVDYKHAGKLFKNLTKSEVVSRDETAKTSNVSFSLKGILNVWCFDYVLAIKEKFPTAVEFHRLSGSFKRNEGYWKLTPLDNGQRTQVVYGKYIDAGPLMPPQIVEREVRQSTQSVVDNLKKVAEGGGVKLASHR